MTRNAGLRTDPGPWNGLLNSGRTPDPERWTPDYKQRYYFFCVYTRYCPTFFSSPLGLTTSKSPTG